VHIFLLAGWVGEVSTQYLISIRCMSRLFGNIPLGFIARGMDWQRLLRAKGFPQRLEPWTSPQSFCLIVQDTFA